MNSLQYEPVSDDELYEPVSEDEEEIQFKEEIQLKEEIKEEIKEEDISIITISSSSSSSENESDYDYVVEEVLAERRKDNQTEYLIKFEGIF
jgi:ribose 5-phosphate isomerase RpiB